MRAIWNGAIGFGLVNIPIKLYSASESSTLDLDMLDKRDLGNIRYKRVNENTNKEVPWENIVKGYKIEDNYIVLDDDDFEAVSPEKSKILSIKQFVSEDEVDVALFETPYFLEPQAHGDTAYKLLLEALLKTKMAGVGSFILREREILCMIRPYQKEILMVNRMRYPEEMRSYADLKIPKGKAPKAEELHMAEALIKSLAEAFDPSKYKDTYNEDLLKIIKQKAKGKNIKSKKTKEPEEKTIDLMAMLKASLESGKRKAG
ncbi:MAG: Ku protein [Sphingobacterium sp.]|jgi:DNA end-binding protein Ku|uniref:non-homologous end joining protein Ku n=1 Tax=unclassified Sphingobacterium TaxID=2609468 RepID=UPI00098484A6|nr:Ku protein [Sphingobacterium sp. CZ-UAM]MDF2515144.1 Ku protein [Sphingobacterium sp.]OOG19409.1 Ku protein [Sphingobacterium sp. CZ-UAM]